MVYQNIFCNYFIFIKKRHKMDRKILSEIKRFKLMSSYDPKELLSEQIYLIEEVQFDGKTNLFYVEKKDYPNAKYIGYIDDKTKNLSLNSLGQRKIDLKNSNISYYLELGTVVTDNFLETFVEDQERIMGDLNQTLKAVGGADWGNTLQGSGIMISSRVGTHPVATNILGPGFDDNIPYNLLCAEVTPGYSKITPKKEEGPTVTVELNKFEIGSSTKVFCDNMVKVNLNDEKNKKELDSLIQEIVRYINAPDDENGVSALSKLTNMTIQGQADSARPTWSPGDPCSQSTTELDHDYGGVEKKPKDQTTEEERHKMNKFLATMRAKNYKDEIIKAVKEKTGKDITITELDAIDHYGKGDSFRGPQFRSMIFTTNAPKHTYQSVTTDNKSSAVVNYENIIKSGYNTGIIKNLPTGNDSEIDLQIVTNSKGFYAEANETLKENFTDYTSVALPKILIRWGSTTSIEVTTWDSKTYALPMVRDEFGVSQVLKSVKESADSAHFMNGNYQLRVFNRCSSYEDKIQPVTYYESSNSITVNGKTFYKLMFFQFGLVPVGMMGDTMMVFPSEEQLKAYKQYNQNLNYTPKQLQKIKDLAYM